MSAEDQGALAEADTAFVIKRAVKVDSTKEVALRWYNKSANKISSLLYKQAEITKDKKACYNRKKQNTEEGRKDG